MDEKEIREIAKAAMREVISARNSEDRMDALEETVKKHGDALNEINEKLDGKKAGGENAALGGEETPKEEAEEKKLEEKEGASIGNAKPSQDVVKAFATAYNVDFGGKTPSFKTLGGLAGVTETDPVKLIAAVNTKFKEMQGASVQNAENRSASSVEVF